MKNLLNKLKEGKTVVTKTSSEEMTVINILVDNGYGNDVVKEALGKGVYSFRIKSISERIAAGVARLKSTGIQVQVSEDWSLGNKNNTYFVSSEEVNEDVLQGLITKKNKFKKLDGREVDVLEIIG